MPPILDYSSALPWLGSGVLAGLLIFWLARLLFGIDRRRNVELLSVQSALTDARRSASEMTNKAASLESEWARLTNEVGQLQPRAAQAAQYERQLTDAKQADAARQHQLDTTAQQLVALRDGNATEIATLRQDLEAHSSTAKYYESEFNRLHAEHDVANKNTLAISNDLQRTKAGLEAAARDAAEAVRLRSELASAKAENAAARAEVEQRQTSVVKLTSEQAQAAAANEAKLKAALQTAEADIIALRADLDQRRKSDSGHADEVKRLTFDYEGKLKSATSAYAALSADQRKSADEIARLKSQSSTSPAASETSGDSERLKTEIASLNASLTAARASEHQLSQAKQALQNEFLQARTSLEESNLLAASRNDEITRLRAQLAANPADAENYRRFKDALEAANRIAAGLPEKT